jgi:hypothetical protein
MVVVPAATPVTTPLPVPTMAAAVLLLLHTPLPAGSVSVMVAPTQTADAPDIAPAERNGATVITLVAEDIPHTLLTA